MPQDDNLLVRSMRSSSPGSPLELIVQTNKEDKDDLARKLDSIGRVRYVYQAIPYISFLTDPQDADYLYDAFMSAKGNTLRATAKLIRHMDISSTLTIPKPTLSALSKSVPNLEQIGAYAAQEYSEGKGVSVAVIDTGANYHHEEIRHAFDLLKGYNFVEEGIPLDDNGHGTHVAGVIAGKSYGVAPGVQLFSLKALNAHGSGKESDIIAAIDWAAAHQVNVVNMSLGGRYGSRAFREMCQFASTQGMLLVAAAGNEGVGAHYPASFGDSVIAVAAVDRNNDHAPFSNVYETNDISAPGVLITSAYMERYATLSGTSMATPHVSGSLSIALSLDRDPEMERKMKDTSSYLGNRETFGAGLVRADRLAESIYNHWSFGLMRMVKDIVW